MAKRTFDYTPNDLRNPRGANNLSSEAMFYQRSLYKEAIYPADRPKPLDTWYDKSLFGKVDRAQNTVVLKSRKLKTFVDSSAVAVDFVVDAFEALKNHIHGANVAGKLNNTTSGIITNMTVHRGWESSEKRYSNYMESLFSGFLTYYMADRHNEIQSFETFVPHMRNFLLQSARNVAITRTNYMLTPLVSRRSSGLTVSIGNFDAGDDNHKYEEFISNPNFDVYRTCAKNFGFLVDKNMPWILTADLFSKPMHSYMVNYQTAAAALTPFNFFPNYYNLVCLSDIATLKRIFRSFYNEYDNLFPFYETTTHECEECPHKSTVRQHYRAAPVSSRAINNIMTDLDWIRFYIDLREIEGRSAGKNISFIKKQARDIYRNPPNPGLSPVLNAVLFINSIYRLYIYGNSMAISALKS
jgi:hypothetical protein